MIFKNISVKNFYILIFLSLFIVLNFSFNSFSQTAGQVPGSSLGLNSDADLWRYIRQGNSGDSQIGQLGSELSAVMIQSEGDNWRSIRNGPLSRYGAYGLIGMLILLAWFLGKGFYKFGHHFLRGCQISDILGHQGRNTLCSEWF